MEFLIRRSVEGGKWVLRQGEGTPAALVGSRSSPPPFTIHTRKLACEALVRQPLDYIPATALPWSAIQNHVPPSFTATSVQRSTAVVSSPDSLFLVTVVAS